MAAMNERQNVYFISDAHLGSGADSRQREAQLCRWLDSIAPHCHTLPNMLLLPSAAVPGPGLLLSHGVTCTDSFPLGLLHLPFACGVSHISAKRTSKLDSKKAVE